MHLKIARAAAAAMESFDEDSTSSEDPILSWFAMLRLCWTGCEVEDEFLTNLNNLIRYDNAEELIAHGPFACIQSMSTEGWEQFGRVIANSNRLNTLYLCNDALNEGKAPFLFRGLKRSSSIRTFDASCRNGRGYGIGVVRAMTPFLQNVSNLSSLCVEFNPITPEGFVLLLSALRDSPIEALECNQCGLDYVEIDISNFPKNLKSLQLGRNKLGRNSCRELAKILGPNATLTELILLGNHIDDEGISFLVNALRSNKSLRTLYIHSNSRMTRVGHTLLLKLVNDITSIKGTMQSNHTIKNIYSVSDSLLYKDIADQIKEVTNTFNTKHESAETIGKKKVIWSQLNSAKRTELCRLQGLEEHMKTSPVSSVGSLLLPEILEMLSKHHGLVEFHEVFRAFVADLWMNIDREAALQRKRFLVCEELDTIAARKLELQQMKSELDLDIAAISGYHSQEAELLRESKKQRTGDIDEKHTKPFGCTIS
jgi:hypothetical protein